MSLYSYFSYLKKFTTFSMSKIVSKEIRLHSYVSAVIQAATLVHKMKINIKVNDY